MKVERFGLLEAYGSGSFNALICVYRQRKGTGDVLIGFMYLQEVPVSCIGVLRQVSIGKQFNI